MKVAMENWDRDISHHLQMIQAGAEMAARHANQLVGRPNFATLAQDQLAATEVILQTALQKVSDAIVNYGSKPVAD